MVKTFRIGALLALGATACAGLLGLDEPTFDDDGTLPDGGRRDGATGSCAPPTMACGETCIDVTSDPHHCGSCAHDCMTTTCTAGRCAPQILGSATVPPRSVALTDTDVLYTSAWFDSDRSFHTLSRIPKDGGPSTALTALFEPTTGLFVGAGQVYVPAYTAGGGAGIRRISLEDAGVETIDGCNTAWSVTGDSQRVYWFTGNCGGNPLLRSIEQTGDAGFVTSPVVPVLQKQLSYAEFGWIAQDADRIYVAGSTDIVSYDKQTLQDVKSVFTGPSVSGGIRAIVVDDRVYARIGTEIIAIDKTTGASTSLVTDLPDKAPRDGGKTRSVYVDLVLDDTFLYFTTDPLGRVMRVPRAGGAAETLAEDQPGPTGLVLDTQWIYWTNLGDNTIRRVAR